MSVRTFRFTLRLRDWIGILLIAAQIIGVARMPFVRDRFFAWSPHDQRTDVTISATLNGTFVSKTEIAERYGIPSIEWHGAGNVDRIIETAERRISPDQRWRVLLRTSINGRPVRERLFVPNGTPSSNESKSIESTQP
jgi:hypothetical protein